MFKGYNEIRYTLFKGIKWIKHLNKWILNNLT